MDGGMLEEAVGAKLIYNLVLQHFWNGSVLNCRHPYDKINLHQANQTEIFAMDVLDVVETLILLKTVLQEPMLMVRPWIHLTQNQILLNQTKVLATVVDVALTLPKIVTQKHTSMAFLCDRLFNIFLLYNCFIESDKSKKTIKVKN